MTLSEKELLIEIIANVDDIINVLTPKQKEEIKKCASKIQGNYNNLLEGVNA